MAVDDVAALLAAERVAAGVERLEHVAVADRGRDHADPGTRHRPVEAEVAHHGDDDGVVDQLARVAQLQRSQRQHPVAVDDVAEVVDGDDPVAVAVEGQAQVGTVLRPPLRPTMPATSRRSDR